MLERARRVRCRAPARATTTAAAVATRQRWRGRPFFRGEWEQAESSRVSVAEERRVLQRGADAILQGPVVGGLRADRGCALSQPGVLGRGGEEDQGPKGVYVVVVDRARR